MPAGSNLAGIGPAGADPAPAPSAPNATTGPRAILFDPSVKKHVMNADGTLADTHPVDQIVVMAWTTTAGSMPSVPEVGRDFSKIRSSADPALAAKVDVAMRAAIQDLVDAGDVEIVETRANAPFGSKGRIEDQGTYKNLRSKAVQTR